MMSEEIIIGKNPVIEALRSERSINKILMSDRLNQKTEQHIQEMAEKTNVTTQKVPKSRLDQLANGSHQGVIAFVVPYEYASLGDLFKRAEEKGDMPFFLILDELEDPHNLGAILRTADATGVHGVIIPKRRSVGLTGTVAKASAGAIEHVPVVRVTNIARTIEMLKEKHVWVVGTGSRGAEDYRTLDGKTPLALVIGNEGKGMSRLVAEKCDWTVSLPMTGHIPSLNASVASSLLMYEVYRKRNPLGEQ